MTQFFSAPWIRVSTVAAIAVLLAACGKGQQAARPRRLPRQRRPAAAAVATVDGTPISRDAYDDYLKSLLQGKPRHRVTAEQKNQVLDQLISMQLIAAQAVKDGLEKDPDVAARLDVVRMRRSWPTPSRRSI